MKLLAVIIRDRVQHAHVAVLEIDSGVGGQCGRKPADIRRLDLELRRHRVRRALTRYVHRGGKPAQRQILGVELEPGMGAAALRDELRAPLELAANIEAQKVIEVAELPHVHVDLSAAVRECRCHGPFAVELGALPRAALDLGVQSLRARARE